MDENLEATIMPRVFLNKKGMVTEIKEIANNVPGLYLIEYIGGKPAHKEFLPNGSIIIHTNCEFEHVKSFRYQEQN